MALWVIKLSEFDIQYHLHAAIKGQVVANFIAEFTNVEDQGAEKYPSGIYTQTDRPIDRLME